MKTGFAALLYKDLRLMLSGHFFLLAFGSLVLYTCYIQFVYVKTDQRIFPVYLYAPEGAAEGMDPEILPVSGFEEMKEKCREGYAVGISLEGEEASLWMEGSGSSSLDRLRASYALSLLAGEDGSKAQAVGSDGSKARAVGTDGRELKLRREIVCEFLFFELTAVGFLGIASLLFKEKKMGVMKLYAVMPSGRMSFLLSKLLLCLGADLVFAAVFTCLNLGEACGEVFLPVLLQAGILSGMMALIGFLCAVWLADFKQFSLFYLFLAVFICTPVFLAGQTEVEWAWMEYHPIYHLFLGMKNAYFQGAAGSPGYLAACALVLAVLFLAVLRVWDRAIRKE